MIDLSIYIDEVVDSLGGISQEFYNDKLAMNDLKKAYKFIYMIAKKPYQDEMDADNLVHVENCLILLTTYYAYRTWTMIASSKDASMPETSSVQMNYLMEDARNCLSWISAYPLDANLQPMQINITSAGAIRGPTVLGGITPCTHGHGRYW